MTNYNRYHGYNMVNSYELGMDEVGFDELPKRRCSRGCKIIAITTLICLLLLLFLLVFVVLPIAFMNSITLQRQLVFTHFNLPQTEEYFTTYRFPSYKNRYVEIKDIDDRSNVTLGVWHILPERLAYIALHNSDFDYDRALMSSDYSVLIYFHGTGESRSDSHRKYQSFSRYFHIIAFDYRSYADSSRATLSETAVINDCLQLFWWVKNRTNSDIYLWGHSLGASLAAHSAALLEDSGLTLDGLVIESGFTSLREELYVHPYVKLFAWLPWFEATIINPLSKNGFIFDTANNILRITCPIMILHAEDDKIIPVKFGRELYKTALERKMAIDNSTIYHEFESYLEYGHLFIYQDPFLKYYIRDFMLMVQSNQTSGDQKL